MLFYQFLESEKQFSHHTVKNYRRDISRFMVFLKAQSVADWEAIDEHHIRQFVSQVHRQGLGGKSIQRLLSALRRLFRYLLTNKRIRNNPASHVMAPKSEKKLPDVMHPQEIEHMLLAPDDQVLKDNPLMVRDYAVLELLYAGGLRLSELIGLNVSDVNWQVNQLKVSGKGGKERLCHFGKNAGIMLKKWLKCREMYIKSDEKALFISRRGTRLSASSIRARIQKLCQEKDISQRVYPHLMRHSFASHMLESSQDLRAVQELLGHAHLKTTQIYTHLDFQQLAKTYDAAHPRAQKKK
ncbi:MAG: tyrosine recombinase XerC [endosymbiont of Galathealinum brachiosum]|uniref:Tyrosine recombinase XerC n=1 Tax=endosymbiont of Galathealinum brachiosum TaxID=2200906 RepID=A0A370DFP8_9GAMM|nr:MAG: tyrosine recombinase XerC [endosymbiont of Galathealinum brachiosum]